MNQRFALQIAEEADSGDIIWVHDYHLMLLPRMLRAELEKRGKSARIGFSLHTPFPSSEIFRTLPVNKDILDGLLNSDLIGFHTDDYMEHFLESCKKLLYVVCLPLVMDV